MVPVNYNAVIIAAIAQIVLGFLWYGPLFGKRWMHMMKFTAEDMKKAQEKGMGPSYALMALGSFAMSWILAHALIFSDFYLGSRGIAGGLMTGFFNWLGFIAPVTLGSVLWEGKPWKLWVLNSGYYLIGLLLMGMILSFS